MKMPVILVGASTGGTDALKVFLGGFPPNAPPILVVQHMPHTFTRSFAARLDEQCRIHVCEAQDGMPLEYGTAYIAPGNAHLALKRASTGLYTSLMSTPPVNRHCPSVEVLFDAGACLLGADAIGVMLTGMGRDGAAAMKRMHDAGAWCLAQDEASAVVFGMPRAAIALGAVDEVVPLDRLAERVQGKLSGLG